MKTALIQYREETLVIHYEPLVIHAIRRETDLGEDLIGIYGPNEKAMMVKIVNVHEERKAELADAVSHCVMDAYEKTDATSKCCELAS
ncbi:hypothetical protein [Propionivibrio sp.]|uniref:hypothetical protein n=1 Tax=Propionivibrio sp. TaxID=2212460 RepID=UPI003BF04EDE